MQKEVLFDGVGGGDVLKQKHLKAFELNHGGVSLIQMWWLIGYFENTEKPNRSLPWDNEMAVKNGLLKMHLGFILDWY